MDKGSALVMPNAQSVLKDAMKAALLDLHENIRLVLDDKYQVTEKATNPSMNDYVKACLQRTGKTVAEKVRASSYKRLDSTFSDRSELDVFFIIDEVHELGLSINPNSEPKPERDELKIDSLYRAMNNLLGSPIFFVVMSTQSRMTVLAPTPTLHPSHRYSEAASHLNAPISECPFDCFVPNEIDLSRVKAETLSNPIFLALFGRPL